MILRSIGLLVLAAVLALPAAAAGSHYVPQAGDNFHYYETLVVSNGMGNYSGYADTTFVNGSVGVTGVAPSEIENASYQNLDSWRSNQGQHESWTSAGTFTFSAGSFQYVSGSDNQTGYANPVYVWFYMDNGLAVGTPFSLLNTAFDVVSRNFAYNLGGTQYVETVFAEGNGSYTRDDSYGVFTATYNWKAYFDPGTGYIVGYLYTEADTNGMNGFTFTDTLYVTSHTYPLVSTSGSSTTGSTPLAYGFVLELLLAGVVVVLIVVVAWLIFRSRNRPKRLPQHAAPGAVGFGPPPMPMGGGAPPIHLTPSGQPVPQVVLRETVKVKCRYCGTLIDVTDKVCPNCGAPLG